MLQNFEFCTAQIAVKLLFMADGKIYSLSAYVQAWQVLDYAQVTDKILLAGVGQFYWQVLDYAQVTDEILLHLPMLKSITYNDGNMVTKFSR